MDFFGLKNYTHRHKLILFVFALSRNCDCNFMPISPSLCMLSFVLVWILNVGLLLDNINDCKLCVWWLIIGCWWLLVLLYWYTLLVLFINDVVVIDWYTLCLYGVIVSEYMYLCYSDCFYFLPVVNMADFC